MDELDTVLVSGKRIVCSPGLRFIDEEAVKLSRRCEWILGFGKLEELNVDNVYLDWVAKAAMTPKVQLLTNCLLKLEESRNNEKIKLNEEQRVKFTEDLCDKLIAPTGHTAETLTKDGYFVLKKWRKIRPPCPQWWRKRKNRLPS